VADEHDARTADALDDVANYVRVKVTDETLVDGHRDTDRVGDELGRLTSAEQGAGDDCIGRKSALGEERSQSRGLASSLWTQWSFGVGPVPVRGVAGVRVAEKVELELGGVVGIHRCSVGAKSDAVRDENWQPARAATAPWRLQTRR